jgi:hypothetical protein
MDSDKKLAMASARLTAPALPKPQRFRRSTVTLHHAIKLFNLSISPLAVGEKISAPHLNNRICLFYGPPHRLEQNCMCATPSAPTPR